MKRLDRYILAHVAYPCGLAFAVVTFLVVANELREQMRDLPVALMGAWDVIRLCALFVPFMITLVIPITYLLGILFAFGKLADQGEIIAMKAAGIPLKRVAAPVILAGAALSLAAFLIQDGVQPAALRRAFDIMGRELPGRMTLDALPAGMMHRHGDWQVYFGRKDPNTLRLYDIDIVKPGQQGGEEIYHAESAALVRTEGGFEIVLTNPRVVRRDGTRVTADTITIPVAPPATDEVRGARNAYNLRTLLASEERLTRTYRQSPTSQNKDAVRKERAEIAERLSLPFAVFAVAFVGAPLGVRAKRAGRSYIFAAGFVVILGYYLLQVALESNALKSLPTVILNAWIPNFVLFGAGMYLLWRVDRV